MDAITFIRNEHKKIRRRFKVISKKNQSLALRQQKFKALCRELVIHETMEHKTWYPHFRKELRKLVNHLLKEEKSAAKEITKFKKIKAAQPQWEPKFLKFKKAVEKHAGEEEKKLFPKVRKLLDTQELKKIGKKMAAFKRAKASKL